MLLSMTGFGKAQSQGEFGSLTVELRAVNNRYLKVSVRGSDPYPAMESDIEKIVRKVVRRGTVQVHIRAERTGGKVEARRLDHELIRQYIRELTEICVEFGNPTWVPHLIAQVPQMPGVIGDAAPPEDTFDTEWPIAERTIETAVENLQEMRRQEGAAMAEELREHARVFTQCLEQIKLLVPQVATGYRQRLQERIREALQESAVPIEMPDLIREVAVYSERSDISEEVMRLGSHLQQFHQLITGDGESPGRKLEFVTQEMNRETNTIGSKAGDVAISQQVFEMKAILEKIREMLQNVE
ncbi:YicC/YloC family endoribonuclease [Tuwongella immobilis]|uniref:YicC family protein n=1 Tax=Tuwongella immobilis TaxID=692036 RepID=A0A6C2YR97_9BACT|nr:YicC/YloC family endoribonuclease [Tuwongella immobilis]VIP04180.1 TIGR00255 family protein OS=Singulisphaera acidiphila (strain ATCC BAA-1392 / DSM 18658 / VKM B-2454 / MOB10) GN=Sinac_1491 PE=4 SV=1: YicC_N: DUF1732 [Tuwongella immobilis]VTS05724.1 TIGR00255 family protein OS=Singulisphaera acidiphila (strain ATCC BAA-1392 / DSM 18658 / VKM B-2454 / MOB10) GN=Sinac_1491 PE=4 SV=1: YicC_N: DUF1732 [Tuwongella immobilis]